MNWLALVAIAVLFDSIRIFIDNYVSDVYFKKHLAVSQKLYYGVLASTVSLTMLAVTGFNIMTANLELTGLLILSGLLSSIAGIPYIRALEIDDSTNLGIFIQLAPVLYLILGWFFLDESFSPIQLVAFAIILSAPILIVLTSRKKSRHTKLKAVLYAFLYVLIAVIGNLIFVKANTDNTSFIGSIALLFFGKGIGNILVVWCRPKWHRRFYSALKACKYKALRPMTVNYAISVIKDFAYRGALTTAPAVAIASATSDSAEPIVIFFMGIVLTLIWPKFGREKLDRKTVMIHLASTILVVIGIIILQTHNSML